MKLIEKIEIQYFRSIYRETINSPQDLNIFTGKNDAGKSNILKALNLFFNNETDAGVPFDFSSNFNFRRLEEVRKESIKGKQFIQIKVTFRRGEQSIKTLPEVFTVTKKWLRNDVLPSSVADDVEKRMLDEGKRYTANCKASLTAFLNKIQYVYIPAIKDAGTFDFALKELQNCVFSEKLSGHESFSEYLFTISNTVAGVVDEINEEFCRVTGVDTSITTPQKIHELYKTMNISTKYGSNDVDLNKRGDGIRVRYIPSIYNYIAKASKKNYIWGFEEPENSLEYNMALEMSKSFQTEYCKGSNIFLTSHSPAFITLPELQNTQHYRCFNTADGTRVYNHKEISRLINQPDIEVELGYIKLQQELYAKYENAKLTADQLSTRCHQLESEIRELKKPVLLTEGKTDVLILEKAWEMLYQESCPFVIKSCDLSDDPKDSCAGCNILASCLKTQRHDNKSIVIGLFDRDTGGIKAYNLDKNFKENSSKRWKISKNKKAYAFLIPIPTGKEKFAEFENLSIEFLFDRCDLEKEVNGIRLGLKPQELRTICGGKIVEIKPSTEFHLFSIDDSTKAYFAETIVPTFSVEAFSSFRLLFQTVLDIISDSQGAV